MFGVFAILLVLGVALDCSCGTNLFSVPEIATSSLSKQIIGKPIENDFQPRENAIREATFGKVPKKFYTGMKNEVSENHEEIPKPFNLQNDMLVNPEQPNYNNELWIPGPPRFPQSPIFDNYFQRYPDFGFQMYPGLQDRPFMMRRIIRGMIQDLRRLIYRLPGRLQMKLLSPEPLETTRPERMIATDDFPRFRNSPVFLPIGRPFPRFVAPDFQPNDSLLSRDYPEPNFGNSRTFPEPPVFKPMLPEPRNSLEFNSQPNSLGSSNFQEPNFQPNNFLERTGFPEPPVFKPMLPGPKNSLEFNSQQNSLGSSNFQEPNFQPNNFLERKSFPEPPVFKPMLPEPRISLEFNSRPNSLGSSNFQEPNFQPNNFLERRSFPETPVFKPMLPEPRNSLEFNSQPNSLGSSNFQEPNFQPNNFLERRSFPETPVFKPMLPEPRNSLEFNSQPNSLGSSNFQEPNFQPNNFLERRSFPETPVFKPMLPEPRNSLEFNSQPNSLGSSNYQEPNFQVESFPGSKDYPKSNDISNPLPLGGFTGSPEFKRFSQNFPESQNFLQAPPRFPETPVLKPKFPVFLEPRPGNILNSRNVPEPRFQVDNSLGPIKAPNFPEISENEFPSSYNNNFESFGNFINNAGNAGAERTNFGRPNQFLETPEILFNDVPQSRGF